jgi:perosamine synthetase
MQEMLEAGVATRRGVMAVHLESYYQQRFPNTRLPLTENATRRTLLLPNYATMTEGEQEYVIEHLRRILSC